MKPIREFALPPEHVSKLRRAVRLAWITVGFSAFAATTMGMAMGTSQAMKTAFFDDLLGVLPAITFLIATSVAARAPSVVFPYGRRGAVSIGYLTSSLALVAMSAFLLVETGLKLAHGERTTIGAIEIGGHVFWAGWVMVAAAVVTSVPAAILGRMKLALAPDIHDKILFADAKMMKADWLTGAATVIGVLGVGVGWSWLDPVVAALVALDIGHDGVSNLRIAAGDLMERRPQKTDASGPHPLPDELQARLAALDWVAEADVRVREVGRVFFAELFLVPHADTDDLLVRAEAAADLARALDWRLHEVVVCLRARL